MSWLARVEKVVVLVNPRRACVARVYCSCPVCITMYVCMYVCVYVCVCVHSYLPPRAIRRTNSSISDFSAIRA